jgi:LysR family transcriptional repressor of citA
LILPGRVSGTDKEERMDLHQLEAFYTVAKEKSFSRAAEVLHLTQSAISTRITNLEAQLEADLFIRHGRTLRLSKYGEAFEPYVHQILLLVEDAKKRIGEIRKVESSRLEIGTTSSLAVYLLPRLISEFQTEMPEVEIQIKNISAEKIMEMLENGAIQLGFVNFSADDQRFAKIPLVQCKMILAAAPGHPLLVRVRQEGCFRWEWLEETPVIHFDSGSKHYRSLLQVLKRHNIGAQNHITINNNEAIKRMAIEGVGVAFLPDITAQKELSSGDLVEIPLMPGELFTIDTYLLYLRQEFMNPVILKFISVLQNMVQPPAQAQKAVRPQRGLSGIDKFKTFS